jgi:hypothetical protein
MNSSGSGQERRAPRSKLLMAASVEHDGSIVAVTLRDLSANGALVEGDHALQPGAPVVLRKNELAVSGQVAWAKGRRAGIVFAAPLAPETVQRHLRGPKTRGSEPMIKKRPGFRGRLSPEERRIAEQLWGGPLPPFR